MTYPPPPLPPSRPIPKARNIFVSYQHSTDQGYYDRLSEFAGTYGLIRDTSLRSAVNSDNAEYIMQRIREDYIDHASCTFVLCGVTTRWRRFVDWEIKATLDRKKGLVGVLLSTNRVVNGGAHKPDRLQDNIDSGYAVWTTWDDLIGGGPEYTRLLVEIAIARDPSLIENGRDLRKRSFGGASLGPPPVPPPTPPPSPPPLAQTQLSALGDALLRGVQSGRLSNLRLEPPPGSLASMLSERYVPSYQAQEDSSFIGNLLRQRYRDEYDQLFGAPTTLAGHFDRERRVKTRMGEEP